MQLHVYAAHAVVIMLIVAALVVGDDRHAALWASTWLIGWGIGRALVALKR